MALISFLETYILQYMPPKKKVLKGTESKTKTFAQKKERKPESKTKTFAQKKEKKSGHRPAKVVKAPTGQASNLIFGIRNEDKTEVELNTATGGTTIRSKGSRGPADMLHITPDDVILAVQVKASRVKSKNQPRVSAADKKKLLEFSAALAAKTGYDVIPMEVLRKGKKIQYSTVTY